MATPQALTAPDQFEAVKAAGHAPAQTGNESVEAKLNDLFKKLDKSTWRNRQARFFVWFQCELFWRGIQLFTYDPDLGTVKIWEEEDQDLYNPINLTLWSVEMNAAEYTKSRPRLVPHSNVGEDRKVLQALGEVEYLSDCLIYDLWLSRPELEQREAHRVQFRGGVVGLVDFDPKAGPKHKVPRYSPQTQSMPGTLACPDCGLYEPMEGEPGQPPQMETAQSPAQPAASPHPDNELGGLPAALQPMQPTQPTSCPQCGSANVNVSQPTPVQTLGVEGYDEIPQGAVTYEDFDLFQVGMSDRVHTLNESSWVRLDEVKERTKVKEMFPWVEIADYEPTPAAFGQYSGLHFLRQLEVAIGNSGELDQAEGYTLGRGVQITDELTCLLSRVFLDHHVYAEWPVPANGLQLPGTTDILPPGTKLGDVFLKGMLCWLVNEQIVKMDNVDKNTRLTMYKYAAGASGVYSAGCDSIISINKAYNEENSIGLAWLLAAAFGVTLADEKIKGITNSPDWVGVVEDRRPDEKLSDMYLHVQNPGPTAEVEAMKTAHKQDVQLVGGARNPNVSGMPGEGMRTATGVSYQSATSDSFAAMRLQLRAWQRAEAVTQAVNLWRENALRPQWFSRYGETRGRFIDPATLPGDISFRVEEDSHQPRTNDDVRADTQIALQLGWGSGMLPLATEDHISQTFRMPKTGDSYDLWRTKIEKRLDAMKQIAQMLEQAGLGQDEQGLQFVMQPMMPRPIDNPVMFIRFFTDLYVSDEFDNYSPLMQTALEQLYQLYQLDAATKMAQQNGLAAAAAPPEEDNKKSKGASK